MDEIRPWLFIGKYRDTLQLSYLRFKVNSSYVATRRKSGTAEYRFTVFAR